MGVISYEIPDELHRAAKTCAAADGVTLRAFIVTALMAACERGEYRGTRARRKSRPERG